MNEIGELVPNWTRRPYPLDFNHIIQGQYCRLELLNSKTDEFVFEGLFQVFKPNEDLHFKYLKYGPFQTVDEFKAVIYEKEKPENNTVLYTIFVNDKPVGFLGFIRISPNEGTIEIGNINFSEKLTQTREATETIFLLLQFAFDTLGYRRVEWRCNTFNEKSRRAAIRFGFQYDGTWLKTCVIKGRSRDDAWYSIIDDEWIEVKKEYQRWLNPSNFNSYQQQLSKLNAAQVNPREKK